MHAIRHALQALRGKRESKCIFKDTLKVEFSEHGESAKTTDFMRFKWNKTSGASFSVFIPAGFVCDGASVPRLLWAYASPWAGPWARPAVLHDYLLNTKIFPVALCDELFLDALLSCGCSCLRSVIMFLAVRAYTSLSKRYRNH